MADSSQNIKRNGNNQNGSQNNNQNRRPLNENHTNVHDSISHGAFENHDTGRSIDKQKYGTEVRHGS